MWMLRLKDGLEMTEKELGYWDNVPTNAEIKSLAVAIERKGLPPYIVEVKDYDEICCAKSGSSAGGSPVRMTGWVIFAIRGEIVTEFSIRADGIQLKSYDRASLTLRPDCLRRMAA